MMIKKFMEKIIYIMPNSFWLGCYKIPLLGNKLKKRIEGVRITSFVRKTDFDRLNTDNYKTCSIDDGDWDYGTASVCFIEDAMQKCLVSLSYKMKPYINIFGCDHNNLWNLFYEQPYVSNEVMMTQYQDIDQKFVFKNTPNSYEIKLYSHIFQHFIRLNSKTQKYVDEEFSAIMPKGKKIIGVLCRGTDYVGARPKGHPIQPEVSEVIEAVQKKMEEYKYDYLYLATDEYRTELMFRDTFGDKVLINKRMYYDEYNQIFGNNPDGRIGGIHKDRENDNYYRSLEYISSLNLLTKCNSFIAGNCGGSRAVLYLNGGEFEYSRLFDLGLYS